MAKASATATATREASTRTSRSVWLTLVLEYRRPLASGARWALRDLDEVQIGRGGERATIRDAGTKALAVEVPDGRMSTRHGRLARLATGWAFEDLGSKNGSRVGGAAVKSARLADGDLIELGETLFLFHEEEEGSEANDLAAPVTIAPGLTTLSPSLARSYADLAAVASADVPVLLLGETGTGKEVAARAVHGLSGRKGRFVAVNCGALPRDLVEAELFGHRQGAFSGATESRVGLVRSADKGTLFLDEIGDLPLTSQAALLRVLQEREVTGVGETVTTKVDIRVVAATHRDLRAECEAGRFRSDLLARLEGYSARLPPLRDRCGDLGDLIATLIRRIAPDRAERIALQPAAARAFATYDFPCNVRELEQALRASLALARDDVITLAQLPERMREPAREREAEAPVSKPTPSSQLSAEDVALKQRLGALFTEHAGSINGVARAMGKDRTQIKRWIARFGIDPEAYR
jgi:transcriptional regulator with GAF, ATPase, and Fis domain